MANRPQTDERSWHTLHALLATNRARKEHARPLATSTRAARTARDPALTVGQRPTCDQAAKPATDRPALLLRRPTPACRAAGYARPAPKRQCWDYTAQPEYKGDHCPPAAQLATPSLHRSG